MPNAKSFFNNAAPIWDRKSRRHDDANVKTMLRLSDIKPNSLILDAGCGTGFLEPYLLSCRPAKILAVDFAEKMIEVARSKRFDPRVEFRCADLLELTSADFICDYCFFYNAFPHFEEPKALIAHVATLIKPGGRLSISHTQGKKTKDDGILLPRLPAQGYLNVLQPYFRPDVIVDNNVMFLLSAVRQL